MLTPCPPFELNDEFRSPPFNAATRIDSTLCLSEIDRYERLPSLQSHACGDDVSKAGQIPEFMLDWGRSVMPVICNFAINTSTIKGRDVTDVFGKIANFCQWLLI